jgi:hypothetical protein
VLLFVPLVVTNSSAFSPTDAMPLSHRAELLMGAESVFRDRLVGTRHLARREPSELTARSRPERSRGRDVRGDPSDAVRASVTPGGCLIVGAIPPEDGGHDGAALISGR